GGDGPNVLKNTHADGSALVIGDYSSVVIGGAGLLEATGGADGSGIDISDESDQEGALDIDGDVIVTASSTSGTAPDKIKGILANVATSTIAMAGNVTLPATYEISAIFTNGLTIELDTSLTVPAGKTLTIAENAKLIVYSGLNVEGTINNSGTLTVSESGVVVAVGGKITNDGVVTIETGIVTNNGTVTNNNTFTIDNGGIATNGDIENHGMLNIGNNSSITGDGKVLNDGNVLGRNKITVTDYESQADLSVTTTFTGDESINEYTWAGAETEYSGTTISLNEGDIVELKGDDPESPFVIQPAYDGAATVIGKSDKTYTNITIANASTQGNVDLTIQDLHITTNVAIISYNNSVNSGTHKLTFKGNNEIINSGAGNAIESADALAVEADTDDDALYASGIKADSSGLKDVMIADGNVETINDATTTDASILNNGSTTPVEVARVEVQSAAGAAFPKGALVTAEVPGDVGNSNDPYTYVSPVITDGGNAYLWLPAATVTVSAVAGGKDYVAQPVDVTTAAVNEPVTLQKSIAGDITVGFDTATYNGSAQRPAVTVTDNTTGNVLAYGVDYTLAYAGDIAVGPSSVTVVGQGAYIGEEAAPFTIAPAPLDVTNYAVKDKVYDGAATATFAGTPALSGAIYGSDAVTLTNGTPTFASADVGTGIGINFTPFTIDNGNYALTNPQPTDATANITSASTPAQTVAVTAVSVQNAPATFRYKASGNGNAVQLYASLAPANATDRSVKWSSSNTSIATVDANGLVAFRGAEGNVGIMAASGNVVGTATIKVVRNVTGIRTPLAKVYVQKGKSLTIPVALIDNTNSKATFSSKLAWKSSKKSIARVDNKGKVTARKAGSAKITVTAADGKSKAISVVVASKATKLKKVTANIPSSLGVGKSYQLKVKLTSAKATGVEAAFKSSNSKALKVDKSGRLVAQKKGKATITVTAGGKSYKKAVTVK
ncbi:MAG: Ig-like domain-containing protein, partial [Clostridiales Family XIII bacterium]|nr:Ig-like domain-containing protein [Clostridiales Family XIII bacterium]